MTSQNRKDLIKQICDFMGEDLDGPACQEVQEHLKECPTCRIHFDTVKKTVTMCQENEPKEKLPEAVNDRLFKVLNLMDLKKQAQG